jgi:hypothetical protein
MCLADHSDCPTHALPPSLLHACAGCAAVCLSHIDNTTKEIRHGLPDHELDLFGGGPPMRYRRQATLPYQVVGASATYVGVTFSYSFEITNCDPLSASFAIQGSVRTSTVVLLAAVVMSVE